MIYFDAAEVNTPEKMMQNSCFVKFDAREQIEKYNRTVTQSTLDWWERQSKECKSFSLVRLPSDVDAKTGVDTVKSFMTKYDSSPNQIIWARGSLDQMAIDSLCRKLDTPPLTRYNNWYDVRTAINILATEPSSGYCPLTKKFNTGNLIDHHPVHDCIRDALMLLYYK